MHTTTADIDRLLHDHDGTSGFAGRMCPACQVMHPCPTYRLAADIVELRDRLEHR